MTEGEQGGRIRIGLREGYIRVCRAEIATVWTAAVVVLIHHFTVISQERFTSYYG